MFFWVIASSQQPQRVVAMGCLLPAPLSSFLVSLQPCLAFPCQVFALSPFCCQPTPDSGSSRLCKLGQGQPGNHRPLLRCALPALITLFLTASHRRAAKVGADLDGSSCLLSAQAFLRLSLCLLGAGEVFLSWRGKPSTAEVQSSKTKYRVHEPTEQNWNIYV